MTGAIMLILASLSFSISFTGMPATETAFIEPISEGPGMVMLIINLLLLVVGCVMDMGSANLFFTPILPPIAQKAGYVPVHFGSMMIFNLAMGTITPPGRTGPVRRHQCPGVKVEAARATLPPSTCCFWRFCWSSPICPGSTCGRFGLSRLFSSAVLHGYCGYQLPAGALSSAGRGGPGVRPRRRR